MQTQMFPNLCHVNERGINRRERSAGIEWDQEVKETKGTIP